MPKTARPRRPLLSAVAMVPRQHAAPGPGAETPAAAPRPSSGRPAASPERARIAVLAFLLGFASCYVVLKFPAAPDPAPYARAATSLETTAPAPSPW